MERYIHLNMHQKNKSWIRNYIKNKRTQINFHDIDQASQLISENLFRCQEFIEATTIFLYAALKTEVQTKYIDEKARELGKIICYPKIEGKHIMNFYKVDKKEHLIPCSYGNISIDEPDVSLCEKIISDEHTLIIVPGLAFDYKKKRVGYGGGYYDYYLGTHNKMSAIGICMAFQLVGNIDTNEYDQPVNKIITEVALSDIVTTKQE